jgi:8-oxo-dGTP diphosphatase
MAIRRIPCVGAVIRDRGGRLLLIRRGHEPGAGLWSLPGGRIEPGETDQQAVAREVLEETGLVVTCGTLLGTVELPGPPGSVIDVSDYLAVVTGGELAPGDDADDARWVTAADLDSLPLTSGLADYLTAWGAHPG